MTRTEQRKNKRRKNKFFFSPYLTEEQAVSKWERAEASPDTDNIILLARLYGVSLDELLQTEDEIPRPLEAEASATFSTYTHSEAAGELTCQNGLVAGGFENGNAEDDSEEMSEEEGQEKEWAHLTEFPFALLIAVVYVILGACFNAWHPAWLLFLLIPIWYSVVSAITHRDPKKVAYPVAMALLYLCLGFFCGLWHPGWVVFLTIPLYYPLIEYFMHRRGHK